MSSQQLADDYEQLKELLELYPTISLLKTEGQPPDNYEIAFQIRGFIKNSEDEIGISEQHKVRISLPFGYPHFAPIVKPLTPIFHPDIDPAAIRIAARWQQNSSLAELVLYIGEMICGRVYDLEDPFNLEAATWYRTHKNQLPLDDFVAGEKRVGLIAAAAATGTLKTPEPSRNKANSAPPPPSSPPLQPIDVDLLQLENKEEDEGVDLARHAARIQSLLVANKLFAADALLAKLPTDAPLPKREEIQRNLTKSLQKTNQLLALVQQLENTGKIKEAVEVIESIFEIAVDAPGVEEARTRLQQALQLTQLINRAQKREDKKDESLKATPQRTAGPIASTKQKEKAPGQLLDQLKSLPEHLGKLGAIIGAAVVFCAILVGLFLRDQSLLEQAQSLQQEGQTLIAQKRFDKAAATLTQAKDHLSGLSLLRFQKGQHERDIDALMEGSEFQRGLSGQTRHNGKYLPAETAKALRHLGSLTSQAETLVQEKKLMEALELYRQAYEYAGEKGLDQEQPALEGQMRAVQVQHVAVLAEKAAKDRNWEEAESLYGKALEHATGDMQGEASPLALSQQLAAVTFRHRLDQAKEASDKSQWQQALSFLEDAQKAQEVAPDKLTDKERLEAQELTTAARLSVHLATALDAYQKKNWPLAIQEYEQALQLLSSGTTIAAQSENQSFAKIERTLLLVRVMDLQDNAQTAERNSDLKVAIEYNQEIQQLIHASRYGEEEELQTLSQTVGKRIAAMQEQVWMKGQITWLETNYEKIFRENYATMEGSRLVQPKAVLLKRVNNNTIFRLNCLEQSLGRSTTLEILYMYDNGRKRWSAYTGS